MAPCILCDDGGSQPPYGSKRTSARTQQLRQLSLRQAPSLLRRPRHHTSWVPKSLRLPQRHVLRALALLRSLSRVDACNPLLQAHPTWARDEHEGRGISTSLTPVSGRLTFPLRARPRVDPSGLGHAATFTRRLRDPPTSKRRQVDCSL
jgi:hypothetical protein